MKTVTYYVYFVKKEWSLSDGPRYLSVFRPRFLQPPCTTHDHPGLLVDAVCGESPAERKPVLRLLHRREGQTASNLEALQLSRDRLIESLALSRPLAVSEKAKSPKEGSNVL